MLQHVAIVGSGPAGLFLADALIRQNPGLNIDVFERLPTPYGLARFGVAPDHQGTKAITRQFDRLFGNPQIQFFGGLDVGMQLPLNVLRENYDAVVLAIGAAGDRRLGLPGESLPGVYGSMAFVGWYNGHPDHAGLAPLLDRPGAAVIGNGNVAIDIVRVLSKTPAEMAASDLCAHAAQAIHAAPLRDIYLIGRRGPLDASFTSAELAELGKLEQVRPVVSRADLPDALPADHGGADPKVAARNFELLHEFAARSDEKPIRLHFLFRHRPVAILGSTRAEALQMQGGMPQIDVGTVISAIGYQTVAHGDLPVPDSAGRLPNELGRMETGLYAVGWAKRGPSGTIPTNRAEAKTVADLIVADFAGSSAAARPGRTAMLDWLRQARLTVVDFAAWKKIEAAEIAAAPQGAPRAKLADWTSLLDAAGVKQQQAMQQAAQ